NARIVESGELEDEALVVSSAVRTLCVDLNTIYPELDREIGKIAKEKEVHYLGAPVGGSVSGAEAASLSIMVGGEKSSYDHALPYLEALGVNIFHVGEDYGLGTMVKLIKIGRASCR